MREVLIKVWNAHEVVEAETCGHRISVVSKHRGCNFSVNGVVYIELDLDRDLRMQTDDGRIEGSNGRVHISFGYPLAT
ncbi:hypothetical protein D3C79_969670 [compost metagenome]